jgi:hypothetical protein
MWRLKMKKSKLLVVLSCLLFNSSLSNAQTCNENIIPSTPDSRFVINSDATVVDKETGLTWMRCSLGQLWDGTTCAGLANIYTWEEALFAAENTSFTNQTDWYLPNVKELNSIVELACYAPAINEYVFPNIPNRRIYWSSTPGINDGGTAWYTHFDDDLNFTLKKSNFNFVRLVRKD